MMDNKNFVDSNEYLKDSNGEKINDVEELFNTKITLKLLENIIKNKKYDPQDHYSMIENEVTSMWSSKIILENYEQISNNIYWLARFTYYLAFQLDFIERIKNYPREDSLYLNINSILLYHPYKEIFEEICKQFSQKTVYHSINSLLARQLIEQIIFVQEYDASDIEAGKIILATIASHNKQVRSKEIPLFEGMNKRNRGLFKAFSERTGIEWLVKKYRLSFVYNLFSADVHTPSTIERLIPKNIHTNKSSENGCDIQFLYLRTLYSVLLYASSFILEKAEKWMIF